MSLLPVGRAEHSGPFRFHECAEALKRHVPLRRDFLEIALDVGEPFGLQLPDALAPGSGAAHQSGALKSAQMLGDRLARNSAALRQSHS